MAVDATPPGPFEVPFSVGAFEDRVDFNDPDERARWLAGQPPEVVRVFAARAALRVIPALSLASGPIGSRIIRRAMILRVFRAVASAWAVSTYPGQRDMLLGAARASVSGLVNQSPERSSVYALATAIVPEVGVSARAASAVASAIDEVATAGKAAFEITLKALGVEASQLSQRFSPVTIANSQLWPNEVPEWVLDRWGELKRRLLSEDEFWEVWTEWYEARLSGQATRGDIEVARVCIEDDVWEQAPRVVNRRISELIKGMENFSAPTEASKPRAFGAFDGAFNSNAFNTTHYNGGNPAREHKPDLGVSIGEFTTDSALPNAEVIPPQAPMASQFVTNSDGLIDVALNQPASMPLDNETQREIYEEVRYKALSLSAIGHNQLGDISLSVERFIQAAPEQLRNVSVIRLWSRANTLRLRLKSHQAAFSSVDSTEPALLPPLVAGNLGDLIESFNIFAAGDPKALEMDQVRIGPQEREEAKSIVESAMPIVKALQVSEGVATDAAIETLSEQVASASNFPVGVDGDQVLELSRKSSGNFVGEVLRIANASVKKMIEESKWALKEGRAGAYRAVGGGAGIYIGLAAAAFVVENAANLIIFVERTFHNPALVRMIEAIVQTARSIGGL